MGTAPLSKCTPSVSPQSGNADPAQGGDLVNISVIPTSRTANTRAFAGPHGCMLSLLELPVLTGTTAHSVGCLSTAYPPGIHLGSTHQESSEKQTSVSSALTNQSNYLGRRRGSTG